MNKKNWFQEKKDIQFLTDNIVPILIMVFLLSLFFMDGISIHNEEKAIWEYKKNVENISTRDEPINDYH